MGIPPGQATFSCRIDDQIELRPIRESETQELPELGIWPEDRFPSQRFTLRLVEACERRARGESLACAIYLAGQLVGYTILDIHGQAEGQLHYGLSPAHRGKGIATKSCAAVIDCAFQRLCLKTVKVFVRVSNVRSCRVVERLGFQKVGTEWVHDEDEDGPVIEVAEYLMTKDKWPGCQSK